MKFFVLGFILFFSTISSANATLSQVQLEQNLSDSLDSIITCGEDPVIISSSAMGILLGKMLRLYWARSPYYDNFIEPLRASVQATAPEDFRQLSEYQALIEMTQNDPEFVKCPQKVPQFLFAIDSLMSIY